MSKSLTVLTSLLGSLKDNYELSLNPNTSGKELLHIFTGLSSELNFDRKNKINELNIAKNIAAHPNCPSSIILRLIVHPKKALAKIALENPNLPINILAELIKKRIAHNQPKKIIPLLKNPLFPKELLSDLEIFEEDEIKEYLAQYSSNLTYLETLVGCKNKKIQLALLQNPNSSSQILKTLSKDWWSHESLLNHPNLSEESLIFCRKKRTSNFKKEAA